jgi:hypothetical protein
MCATVVQVAEAVRPCDGHGAEYFCFPSHLCVVFVRRMLLCLRLNIRTVLQNSELSRQRSREALYGLARLVGRSARFSCLNPLSQKGSSLCGSHTQKHDLYTEWKSELWCAVCVPLNFWLRFNCSCRCVLCDFRISCFRSVSNTTWPPEILRWMRYQRHLVNLDFCVV